jgi:hypothetical protein
MCGNLELKNNYVNEEHPTGMSHLTPNSEITKSIKQAERVSKWG